MLLEVIATTLKEAIDIESSGADRIELVTGIKEGGLTPSIGLIEKIVNSVKIPVMVMVRPHSKSFVYDNNDLEVIIEDIKRIRLTNAYGIVFGALTKDNQIDEEVLKKVIDAKGNLSLTFHRAIDRSRDLIESMNILKNYDIDRILTSAGSDSVVDSIELLSQMNEIAIKNDIILLAGSGLNITNIKDFVTKANVSEVHFGSGVKFDNNNFKEIDSEKIKVVKEIIK
ncbi:copper homeostasis protein CutC [Haploplasma axanthum]|nr:copper homeostasis protein CutC [Haploplasma axanthum]